uniref:Pumilio n=1 Tax=Globodera pallida TaxID=36090 RepID=A0A183BKQ5_GLOPA
MAQHQLPLNSLGAGGAGGVAADDETGGNNFLGASPSGTYEGDLANNNNHLIHPHGNSFHGHQQTVAFTSPPPYRNHHQNQVGSGYK